MLSFKNNIECFGQVKQLIHSNKVIDMDACYCFSNKQCIGKNKTVFGTSQNDWFMGAFPSAWVVQFNVLVRLRDSLEKV